MAAARTWATLVAAASGLAALGACDPAPPKPAAPPPPMSIALGDPVETGRDLAYPIKVSNDGATPSPALRLGCRFRDAQGALVFTGGVDVEGLPPGGAHEAVIRVPRDLAARIGAMTCAAEGGG